MSTQKIAIIGGGLAGLYAANCLHRLGIDFDLYEARGRLGGRILSTDSGGLDLGPTWYWPDFQPRMQALVNNLGLSTFEQHEEGDALIERRATGLDRQAGYRSGNTSMRIEGGAARLVQVLVANLPHARVHLQTELLAARLEDQKIHMVFSGDKPLLTLYSHIWLAIPPRLVRRIQFTPAFSLREIDELSAMPTWMAAHAKYVARYSRPFWREKGLSGAAFSGIGPLGEIHDASNENHAALFGFIGIDAAQRGTVSESELKARCRSQLARLFGEEAGSPIEDHLQDWAKERFTATQDDQLAPTSHSSHELSAFQAALWEGRLNLISSEASAEQGGYMEGALLAVEKAVQQFQASKVLASRATTA